MTHTYHVTLPDGRDYNFDGNANGERTPMQFIQDLANFMRLDGTEVAGAKVQRVVEKYRGV